MFNNKLDSLYNYIKNNNIEIYQNENNKKIFNIFQLLGIYIAGCENMYNTALSGITQIAHNSKSNHTIYDSKITNQYHVCITYIQSYIVFASKCCKLLIKLYDILNLPHKRQGLSDSAFQKSIKKIRNSIEHLDERIDSACSAVLPANADNEFILPAFQLQKLEFGIYEIGKDKIELDRNNPDILINYYNDVYESIISAWKPV